MLDTEHLARACLHREGARLSRGQFGDLVQRIEHIIELYETTRPEQNARIARDALREIWLLTVEDDPPVGQIRALIAKLPDPVIRSIEHFADILRTNAVANVERSRNIRGSVPPPSHTRLNGYKGSFRKWAKTAPANDLIWTVGALIGDGAHIIQGRSRGKGKRSRPTIEPRIMGRVRGEGASERHGRPTKRALHDLVARLVDAWLTATKQTVGDISRSDHTGCGELVHSVCQRVGFGPEEVEYALRKLIGEMG